MLSVIVSVLFALRCLSTTTVLCEKTIPAQFQNIQNYVKIIESGDNDNYVKSVTIGESERRGVLLRYKRHTKEKDKPKTHAFYTAVSCKFASWTMGKLYEFVESSTAASGRCDFRERHAHAYPRVLFENRVGTTTSLTAALDKYVKRFIEILTGFLNVKSGAYSRYDDTAVLKTFLSLRIKTHYYINTTRSKNTGKESFVVSDIDVMRIVLAHMTSLQRFLSTNCSEDYKSSSLSSSPPPQFYGYWINGGVDTIDHFLFNIRRIGLEFDPSSSLCSTAEILLDDLVTALRFSDDPLSRDVAGAKMRITADTTISVADVRDAINDDVELIFWYRECVLTAIVKLVLRKAIRRLSSKDGLPRSVVDAIAEMNSRMSSVPSYLAVGFTLLANAAADDSESITELENYYRSLSDVVVLAADDDERGESSSSAAARRVHVVPRERDASRTSKAITLRDLIVVTERPDRVDWPDDVQYLENVMRTLLSNVDDFKCFHRSSLILRDRNEHYNYYIPFADDKRSLLPVNGIADRVDQQQQQQQSVGTCDFVADVHALCRRAVRGFAGPRSHDADESWEIVFKIKGYFLAIVRREADDYDLLKTAYDSATLLVNLVRRADKNVDVYHVQRVLDVVATELDGYAIKRCELFLTLDDSTSAADVPPTPVIEKSVWTFYENRFGTANDDIRCDDDCKYLNAQYLYDSFVKDSDVIKLYGNNVKVYWKGKYRTVVDVYEDAIFFTVNARLLYALYDVYFKFFIAAIYYEVREVLSKTRLKSIEKGLAKIDESIRFRVDDFPRELKSLVSRVRDALRLPTVDGSSPIDEIALIDRSRETKRIIDDEFGRLNIVFEKNSLFQIIKRGLTSFRIMCFTDNVLSVISEEIAFNLKPFKNYFLQLKRENIVE